jgi:hypothetical protein
MSNIKDQIVDVLSDVNNLFLSTFTWSETIHNDSKPFTNDVVTAIALAEVYGSMQLTVGTDEYGNLNKSDVMMFMKNIGGVKKK